MLGENEELYLAFQIPAGGPEVLWVGFYVDEGTAQFFVGAGWADEDAPSPEYGASCHAATAALKTAMGDRLSVQDDNLYCQIDYPLAELAIADDVPDALARLLDEDLPRIVKSKIFAMQS